MKITAATDIDAASWDALVAADRAATFFHTRDWAAALSQGLGTWSPFYVAAWDGGTLVAGVPLMSRRRGALTLLQSMPFGTYGGVLTRSETPQETPQELLAEIARIASSASVASAVVVDLPGRLARPASALGLKSVEEEAQVVRLDRSYDEIWDGFRPSARNKIRKARKAGVTVRRGSSATDFLAYHDMLVECSRRWGEPVEFGRPFFERLALLDPDVVHLWLAEHEGEIIAGDLNFALHDRIANWGNVSRDSARLLAPNNLLHAYGMERGAAEGYRVFDLGSSAGIEGVEAFKQGFGTEPVRYRRYHIDKAWFRTARRLTGRERGGGAS